jgi:enamine deaminase RidA (YjgF/YER057c/UK114 family)
MSQHPLLKTRPEMHGGRGEIREEKAGTPKRVDDDGRRHTPHSSMGGQLFSVRVLEQSSHIEWFLTGRPAREQTTSDVADDLFARTADVLAENHVEVLYEKIFGLRSERGRILEFRRQALTKRGLDATVPVTFLEGVPATGASLAGLQLWGVSPRTKGKSLVSTVEQRGIPVGRRFMGQGFRILTLASLNGSGPDGTRPPCAACQAKNMFVNAGAALAANDHSYRQVARTWIYLARVLDWYGEFNRIRTAHYAREGLSVSGGAVFPASTGIQAVSDDEECLMDLLAVDAHASSGVTVRPLVHSSRQDTAFSYGSAFSRATAIESHGRRTIYISGTASIDKNGRSVHLEDPEAQALDTLLSVAALLEDQGVGLENICHATVFCKNAAAVEAYDTVARRLRLPELPAISVIADVCRPELLIEIEAVAIV